MLPGQWQRLYETQNVQTTKINSKRPYKCLDLLQTCTVLAIDVIRMTVLPSWVTISYLSHSYKIPIPTVGYYAARIADIIRQET